ncbi:MAG: HNH endonuclease [Bacteroidales bacterium]|nr:HNH endonuclease [Bacteroidales bacterium]
MILENHENDGWNLELWYEKWPKKGKGKWICGICLCMTESLINELLPNYNNTSSGYYSKKTYIIDDYKFNRKSSDVVFIQESNVDDEMRFYVTLYINNKNPKESIDIFFKDKFVSEFLNVHSAKVSKYIDETNERQKLEKEVDELLTNSKVIPRPTGRKNVGSCLTEINHIKRDPQVVAYTIQEAHGKCEQCGCDAPFKKKNNVPYLEVHHIIPLSRSHEDTPENCIALCPTCHRKIHCGVIPFNEYTKKIKEKIIDWEKTLDE